MNKKKEFVEIGHLVDCVFGLNIYDYYYGHVLENTDRGTSIVSVEYNRSSERINKIVKCGLFGIFKKTKHTGFSLFVAYKKPKQMEFPSDKLRRKDEKIFHTELVKSVDIAEKMLKDGWVPKDKWVRNYLMPINKKEKKQ